MSEYFTILILLFTMTIHQALESNTMMHLLTFCKMQSLDRLAESMK